MAPLRPAALAVARPDSAPSKAGPALGNADLETLRREIDSIDDTIQDLLVRRAEIAVAVAAAKARAGGTRAPLFRPARETEILRRLLRRNRAPLPAALVLRLWREIIVASTRLQGPFSVAVAAPCGEQARLHFGASVLRPARSVAQVIAAVAVGRAPLGVVPVPGNGADAAWWASLPKGVSILARLPVVAPSRAAGSAHGAGAVIIGRQNFEPSGDDTLYVAVEADSRAGAGLRKALAPFGLRARGVVASLRRGKSWLLLVETAMTLDVLRPKLGGTKAARLLGGSARPLVLASSRPKRKPQDRKQVS